MALERAPPSSNPPPGGTPSWGSTVKCPSAVESLYADAAKIRGFCVSIETVLSLLRHKCSSPPGWELALPDEVDLDPFPPELAAFEALDELFARVEDSGVVSEVVEGWADGLDGGGKWLAI